MKLTATPYKHPVLIFLTLILFFGSLLPAKQLPIESFFRNPEFSGFALSPDGSHLAVRAPAGGNMNIFVFSLEDRKPRQVTGEKVDVTSFQWVSNERLIYRTDNSVEDSRNRRTGGVYAVNKDATNLRVLKKPFTSEVKGIAYRGTFVNVLGLYSEDPEYLLVTQNKRRAEYPDVFLMNSENGRMKRLFNNPGEVRSYILDNEGDVRFGLEINEDTEIVTVLYREPETGKWKQWLTYDSVLDIWEPVYINPKKNRIIVRTNIGRNTVALFDYDKETGKRAAKPLYADETYDIEPLVYECPRRKIFVGFRFQAAKPKTVFFDDFYKNLHEIVQAEFPGRILNYSSASKDGRRMVLTTFSDRHMPEYYLLNLPDLGMEKLAGQAEWLPASALAPTEPIHFKARDGRTIHGYLTLPKGFVKGESKPVPLIVRPHGGPWARDTWGLNWYFDNERQYLANRGVACLEVNFRGSTGYGKDHLYASFNDVDAMHEDWYDGVQWAIKEGYADASRLGIWGASWGGYSVMYGVTQWPDLFKVGINIFGVVDMPEQIRTYLQWDREFGYNYWVRRFGDPRKPEDREKLDRWSPINFIDRIQTPLFVYHGLRDFNVDIKQSRMLVSALRSKDKVFEHIFRSDEAHSISNEEDRIEFYTQVDAFLQKHFFN
jgi:dipeptidyl aminopeptidase/acylaminoacyl peptidase